MNEAQREATAANQELGRFTQRMGELQEQAESLELEVTALLAGNNNGQAAGVQQMLRAASVRYNQTEAQAAKERLRGETATRERQSANQELVGVTGQCESLAKAWSLSLDVTRKLSSAEHRVLEAYFTKMLLDDANHGGALVGRALSRWKIGHPADALADLDRAVQLDDGFAPLALAIRARLHSSLGKTNALQADFSRAFKQSKNHPWVLVLHAAIEAEEKKFVQAEHDLKLAAQSVEAGAEAARLLALLHVAWSASFGEEGKARNDHAKKALEFAQQACDLSVTPDWACLDALAAAQAASGAWEEATRTEGQAAKVAQDDNQAACLERQKRYTAHQGPQIVWP
jgi:hypothetical protein